MSLFQFTKRHIRFTFFFVVNVLLLFWLAVSVAQQPKPEVSLKPIDGYTKEFSSGPIYNNGFITDATIEYPHVQIAPFDIRYLYIPIKEGRDLASNKYDNLFYAGKRISELLKWGNEIPVQLLKGTSAITILDAKESWDGQFIKKFNTWESILTRYFVLLDEKETSLIDRIDLNREASLKELILLSSRIKSHQSDLQLTIENSTKTTEEKVYLTKLVQDLFHRLNAKLRPYVPSFNPTYIYFPLSEVMAEREYGLYEARVSSIGNLKEDYLETQLTIGDSSYRPAVHDTTENELIYRNIQVNALQKPVALFQDPFLRISSKNLVPHLNWKQDKKSPSYTIDFIDNSQNTKYFFRFRSKTQQPIIVKLQHIYRKVSRKKTEVVTELLLDRPINIKAGNAPSFEHIIQLTNVDSSPRHLRIKLESEFPIRKEDLSSISVEVDPFYNPLITLKKISSNTPQPKHVLIEPVNAIGHSITLANLTRTEEKYITDSLRSDWRINADNPYYKDANYVQVLYIEPKIIRQLIHSVVLFNGIALILMLFTKIKTHSKQIFSEMQAFVKECIVTRLQNFSRLKKYALAAALGLLFFFDIFITRSYTDIILVGGILLWIGLLLSFKVDAMYSYVVACILLAIMPVMLWFGKVIPGEKVGIWAFTLLMLASAQLLFQLRWNIATYKTNVQIVLFPLQLIGKWFTRLYNALLSGAWYVISKLFVFEPKNLKDKIRNTMVFIISVMLLVGVFIALQSLKRHIDQQARVAAERQMRENLNPQIELAEPSIAYFSSKIVIYGNNFGWKQSNSVVLASEQGPVSTDLWTNEKIVFTVPLHWKTGATKFWIEKKSNWKGIAIVARSKTFQLFILPRTQLFNSQDEAYFDQLKTLRDETLQINGYNPEDY